MKLYERTIEAGAHAIILACEVNQGRATRAWVYQIMGNVRGFDGSIAQTVGKTEADLIAAGFREVVDTDSWITPVEIARQTETSESYWRNAAAAGKLAGAAKKGKQWLIPRATVAAMGYEVE